MNTSDRSAAFANVVVAAQYGSRDALDTLFAHAIRKVTAWCARVGGPRIDPDESAQEVMIVAFQRLQEVREPAQFDLWLYAITRRVLANHRRRCWGNRWAPEASMERSSESSVAERRLVRRTVRDALEELPESQREVVVWYHLEGYTADETARQMNVPVGTVRSRLRLGRARLRAELSMAA